MAAPRGWTSQEKDNRDSAFQFTTVEPVRLLQHGLSTVSHSWVREVGTDAAEASSTTTSIVATAHSAQKGDIIRFTTGSLSGQEVKVLSVSTNAIEVAEVLPSAPAAADAFQILRHKYPIVNADGTLPVSVSSAPISFNRDTGGGPVATTVLEDTVTPANNLPLPVKLMDMTGDITVTANQLNVNLDQSSDSVAIGDGTDTVAVNGSGELSVTDSTAQGSLSTIAGAVSGSEMQVDIVSPGTLMLDATGAAIGSDTSSIDGKMTGHDLDSGAGVETNQGVSLRLSASGGSVEAGTATDPLRVDPTGTTTQPVSDAGGSLTVDSSDLATIAGAVSGTEMQVDVVASLPAGTNNIGDVDIASALPAGSNNIGDVDIASALPAGTNTIGAVDLNRLDVVDLIDDKGDGAGIVFVANDNIDDSAGTFLEIVASTAAAVQAIQVLDTTGGYIGLFTGPAASEVLKLVIGPGSDQTIQVSIPASTRISVRRMDSATVPLTSGFLAINFLG